VILYRTNNQSAVLEDNLRRRGIVGLGLRTMTELAASTIVRVER